MENIVVAKTWNLQEIETAFRELLRAAAFHMREHKQYNFKPEDYVLATVNNTIITKGGLMAVKGDMVLVQVASTRGFWMGHRTYTFWSNIGRIHVATQSFDLTILNP